MRWNSLESFYSSSAWEDTRINVILERATSDGVICQECGQAIRESKKIIVHHIEELNINNVNDYNISFNHSNLLVVCFNCHNRIHKRFCKQECEKGTYIVYGPPLSGKSTYVKNHKGPNDLVIDLDAIYQAITGNELYNKPDSLKYNAWAVRNMLLDNIKVRYGKFESAWIIGGYADKYEREKIIKDLGATPVLIAATKEECLMRLKSAKDFRQEKYKEWKQYISTWFEKYKE